MLYIPRGWWHYAIPLDEPSLHLTFATRIPSTLAFLEWLSKRMLQQPIGRMDIPATGSPEALEQFVLDLRKAIGSNIDCDSMADFLAEWKAERRARPQFRLPQFAGLPAGGIVDSTTLRLANQRGLAPLVHSQTGETSFEAGGRSWPCSAEAGRALAKLESTRSVAFAELADGLGEQQREELLRVLQGLTIAGEVYCDFPGEFD
jgi:ribosomal protein L16 Arg81 hydroxylase